MTDEEIRLECLKLSVPHAISNPDAGLVIERARIYYAFVRADKPAQGPAMTDRAVSPPRGQGQQPPRRV